MLSKANWSEAENDAVAVGKTGASSAPARHRPLRPAAPEVRCDDCVTGAADASAVDVADPVSPDLTRLAALPDLLLAQAPREPGSNVPDAGSFWSGAIKGPVAASWGTGGDFLWKMALAVPVAAAAVYRFGQGSTTTPREPAGNAVVLSDVAEGVGGFVINGQCAGDGRDMQVAGVGDVNGDGLDDLLIGALRSDPAGASNAGRSYVVFGHGGRVAVDLSAVEQGQGGFVIRGACADDGSGTRVAGVGDVNGDGRADLLVSAPGDDPDGRVYVVFGRTGGAVQLSAIADQTGSGFVIEGGSGLGKSVAAGDFNGDGLADLIVSATGSGAFVVFGKTGDDAVDVADLEQGVGGLALPGFSNSTLAGAGDINGDGLADLIVGDAAGSRVLVVLGRHSDLNINLSDLDSGRGVFVISGLTDAGRVGNSLAAIGDVNGDGLADIAVGAPFGAGRTYLVFGTTSTAAVDLAAVLAGTGGFVIDGACAGDRAGSSLAGVGDVNGDGLADLLVGAPGDGSRDAGRSYVVFGQTGGTAVGLAALESAAGDGGRGGFVIHGHCVGDGSGSSVAGGGDLNGDGLADLVVAAAGVDLPSGAEAGRSYVIYGRTDAAFTPTAVDRLGTAGVDSLTGTSADETLVAGAGNDTLTGGGGADVLYGGAGDDVFVLDAANLQALASNPGDGNYARVDGGAGVDTLRVDGAGIVFDLAVVGNQGAALPGSQSRLESVERIDLTGSGDNTLQLSYRDVIDMAGMNVFNTGNGWRDLGGSVGRHQLVVDGNAGDTVLAGGGWTANGSTSVGGVNYAVYHFGSYVQLLVDSDISLNIV